MHKLRRFALHCSLALLSMNWILGCGAGAATKSTAKTSGTVTYDGQPVTGGEIVLIPAKVGKDNDPGRPATGEVGADGRFVATTYVAGDGATIGKCQVQYNAPAPTIKTSAPDKDGHAASESIPSPYEGLKPTPTEVEIKAGENTLKIELGK